MTDPAAQPHVSVLLDAVLETLAPTPGKLIIDATFGAGGYSRALLDSGCRVIAFDRDPTARVNQGNGIRCGHHRLGYPAGAALFEIPLKRIIEIIAESAADEGTGDMRPSRGVAVRNRKNRIRSAHIILKSELQLITIKELLTEN